MSYEIERIHWTKLKIEDRAENEKQKSFCAVIGQRNILLFNLMSSKQPFQLMFEAKYGRIVDYCLFGDGYLVVGFSNGFLSHVSTHQKEMDQELESERIFTSIDAICVNEHLYKCAVVGDQNKIKIFNMKNWKEIKKESFSLPENCGKVTRIEWSKNGQLLVVGTSYGYLIGILTHLPRLFSYHQNKLAILTSFTQVSLNYISDSTEKKMEELTNLTLEVEPTFMSMGPTRLACGINNFVYLYRYSENGSFFEQPELEKKGDYFSMVTDVGVSETHLATLTENKCFLESFGSAAEGSEPEDQVSFPKDAGDAKIKQITLNDTFLIMLDAEGKITIYSPQEKSICMTVKPSVPIQKMWPNNLGNKSVCVDKNSRPFLFNFVAETEMEIKGFVPQINKVMWDANDPNMFVGIASETAYTFVHNKNFYLGESCTVVYELLSLEDVETTTEVSVTAFDGVEPVVVSGGNVLCLTKSNALQPAWLGSHSSYPSFAFNAQDTDTNLRYFFQNLMLAKFDQALIASTMIPEDDKLVAYKTLADLALKSMNISVAKKAYQLSNNISMVYTLDSMMNVEEKKVLQGFISMVFCDYQTAQQFFLSSSKPELGLDLRCDTKEWAVALNLAENMAPDRVALIRRRFAEDQEKQGQNGPALKNYQASVVDENKLAPKVRPLYVGHNTLCQAGIARTSIRTDMPQRGFEIGQDLKEKDLIWEIASALEEVKANEEAAELYEKAQDFEKAAQLYIVTKNYKKAEGLIEKLSSPKILASLAKMKETEGKFKDAEAAYLRAKDWENVMRLNLHKLNDYDKAVRLFKEKCPTQACANVLAEYCSTKGMKGDEIKFMVLAGKQNEAFTKAQSYQAMEEYANSLEEMSEQEAFKIAQYFEGINKHKEAGIYYEKAGKFSNAVGCFLLGGDKYLEDAIECAAKSQSENLFYKVLEFLEGGANDDPKDPKYAFKLYLAFGKTDEASRTAIAIVKKEMEDGKYKEAHKMLVNMLSEIIERKAKISYDLIQKTIVIHSYTIVTSGLNPRSRSSSSAARTSRQPSSWIVLATTSNYSHNTTPTSSAQQS